MVGRTPVVGNNSDVGSVARVTVSVGVAARTAEMCALQDLINRANAGEHRAKAEGRNRVVVC